MRFLNRARLRKKKEAKFVLVRLASLDKEKGSKVRKRKNRDLIEKRKKCCWLS